MREIGEAVGLTSPSQRRPPARDARAQGLPAPRPQPAARRRGRPPDDGRAARHASAEQTRTTRPAAATPAPPPPTCRCVGRIAAGGPILAEQAVEDVFPLPRQLVGEGTLFLLQVKGDSMIDAAICDGDWVVVRQQPDRRATATSSPR